METFRRDMTALHTWAGVICSGLLFAMFWMGTLSVFDQEIDRWMIPETRIDAPRPVSIDALRPVLDELSKDSPRLRIRLPKPREPMIQIGYTDADGERALRLIDPHSGASIHPTESMAGTGFIFPFHFSFHLRWMRLGYWLVGFLSMAMLVLIVSGVVIHRKIFAEFFVFRPRKQLRRSTLDFHNLTSVIALPFHFMLPFTGLVIFFSIYLPWSVGLAYEGDPEPLFKEMYTTATAEPSGSALEFASLDRALQRASERWTARYGEAVQADFVELQHWGDAAGLIVVRNIFPSRQVSMNKDVVIFSAAGQVLKASSVGPVRRAHAWLSGLHFIQFEHWALRWLYFFAGLSGCAMIASGLLFWIRSRIKRDGTEPAHVRGVRALTVGSVTGLIAATLVFFIANRLLPASASLAGFERSALEVWAFCLAWLGAFVHALWRDKAAWVDQCRAIAGLCGLAVLLNWASTGDHLLATGSRGLWSVFGVDAMLLAGGLVSVWALRRVQSVNARPRRSARAVDEPELSADAALS